MRLAVLSDPHANLPALEAVFQDVKRHAPERIVCLGDLVGYYPFPNEVLEVLRSRRVECIRGNHDRALVGLLEISWFNENAAVVLDWTRERLLPESWDYLRSLEDHRKFRIGTRRLGLYHGSPWDPEEYLFPESLSGGILVQAQADIVLLGHTHVPMAGRFGSGLVANPGSVGQPRDGDTRAAYAILDTETLAFEVHRVPYDPTPVVERMEEERLPRKLAERLLPRMTAP